MSGRAAEPGRSGAAGPPLDAAAPVRRGEELDLPALAAYLHRRLPEAGLDVPPAAELVVLQFASGWSNLTYLLRFGAPEDGIELVLRRPPFGDLAATAHDMAREHRVLAALTGAWELAPRPYLYCGDPAVIGAPFYVMERRTGLVLRRELPPGLELPPARARALSEALADALAGLHRLDPAAVGLGDLGRPEGYPRRQVEGWSARYRRAATDDHPELEEAIRWLAGRVPAASAAALVHNDFKYDNLVLDPADPTRVTAVLDWEMATVGDPRMDLGTTLGYWVEAGDPPELRAFAMGPTALPGSLTRRELAERWAAATGAGLDDLVFHYVFGLFKIAVIVQQIHARWRAGATRDPRFAGLDRAVALFGRLAASAAARGDLAPA